MSDIDIHVVVEDNYIDHIVNNRRDYASQPEIPILLMDNLNNAPPYGAYLLALYAGEVGPLHVDWFWHSEGVARIPDDEKLLFNRSRLPVISGEVWRCEWYGPPRPEFDLDASNEEILTHKITYFWAMSVVVAKYIARRDNPTVVRMTRVIAKTLTELDELLNRDLPLSNRDKALTINLKTETSGLQFQVLDSLVGDAKNLHDEIISQSGSVPSNAIPYIYSFFDLTRSMATDR